MNNQTQNYDRETLTYLLSTYIYIGKITNNSLKLPLYSYNFKIVFFKKIHELYFCHYFMQNKKNKKLKSQKNKKLYKKKKKEKPFIQSAGKT